MITLIRYIQMVLVNTKYQYMMISLFNIEKSIHPLKLFQIVKKIAFYFCSNYQKMKVSE